MFRALGNLKWILGPREACNMEKWIGWTVSEPVHLFLLWSLVSFVKNRKNIFWPIVVNKFFLKPIFSTTENNIKEDEPQKLTAEPTKKDEDKENDIDIVNLDTNKMLKDLENFLKDDKVAEEKIQVITEDGVKGDKKPGNVSKVYFKFILNLLERK